MSAIFGTVHSFVIVCLYALFVYVSVFSYMLFDRPKVGRKPRSAEKRPFVATPELWDCALSTQTGAPIHQLSINHRFACSVSHFTAAHAPTTQAAGTHHRLHCCHGTCHVSTAAALDVAFLPTYNNKQSDIFATKWGQPLLIRRSLKPGQPFVRF